MSIIKLIFLTTLAASTIASPANTGIKRRVTGVNCNGSLFCDYISGGNDAAQLAGAMNAYLNVNYKYSDGEHLACMNNGDNICAFLQGTGGLYGSEIITLAQELIEHGCSACGSQPVEDNNSNVAGMLTFNFVASPNCQSGSQWDQVTVCAGN